MGIEELSSYNQKLINDFLKDIERGDNIPRANKTKRRSHATILKYKRTIPTVVKLLQDKPLDKLHKHDLINLFNDMSPLERVVKGKKQTFPPKITKSNKGGEKNYYRNVAEFVKNMKVFYGWLYRTGKIKEDIAPELVTVDYEAEKSPWVYLGQEKMKLLIDQSIPEYRPLIAFLYDTGMRCQEAFGGLKVHDLTEDCKGLTIREPVAKKNSFGRTIKVMKSSELIKSYIEANNLKSDDDLFKLVNAAAFNKYLKRQVLRLFGDPVKTGNFGKLIFEDVTTEARGKLSQFKLTDIRHNSVCYWLDRYKRNSDLMYRFGWKREDKVFYYSEFLHRSDHIDEDDMFTSEDRTKMEKELEELRNNTIPKDEYEELKTIVNLLVEGKIKPKGKTLTKEEFLEKSKGAKAFSVKLKK